jgi:hypothetical protein
MIPMSLCFNSAPLRTINILVNTVSELLYTTVPDKRSRSLEVVVVRRINLGSGNLEWGGDGKGWERGGQFTSNLRPRWADPVTEGGFPSK